MFGYNIGALIIILVIALLLFGPKRLPELGESIGKAIRGFKKAHDTEPEVLPHPEGTAAGASEPAAKASTCPKCQKEVTGDFAFCPHCGGSMKA